MTPCLIDDLRVERHPREPRTASDLIGPDEPLWNLVRSSVQEPLVRCEVLVELLRWDNPMIAEVDRFEAVAAGMFDVPRHIYPED